MFSLRALCAVFAQRKIFHFFFPPDRSKPAFLRKPESFFFARTLRDLCALIFQRTLFTVMKANG